MKDEIVIAEAFGKEVRIHAARTTAMCEEARIKHHCLPTSAAALGRIMTVTALMASDLKKDDETITVVFNGHGPAGTVLVNAKGNGDVKGFISDPSLYLVREDGHLAVGQAIGTNGTLTVTKDLGLKEPFSGMVKLQTGEVGEDFAYYFTVSEQTPSAVSVGVLVAPEGNVQAAGGMIIQMMPGAKSETVDACVAITSKLPPMSTMIESGMSIDDIIHKYFPDANILGHRDTRYHCGCIKEHYSEALATLKDSDLDELIEAGRPAEIVCQYCNTKYEFTPDELKEIKKEKCGTSVK